MDPNFTSHDLFIKTRAFRRSNLGSQLNIDLQDEIENAIFERLEGKIRILTLIKDLWGKFRGSRHLFENNLSPEIIMSMTEFELFILWDFLKKSHTTKTLFDIFNSAVVNKYENLIITILEENDERKFTFRDYFEKRFKSNDVNIFWTNFKDRLREGYIEYLY